jgi:hypothetical protein
MNLQVAFLLAQEIGKFFGNNRIRSFKLKLYDDTTWKFLK